MLCIAGTLESCRAMKGDRAVVIMQQAVFLRARPNGMYRFNVVYIYLTFTAIGAACNCSKRDRQHAECCLRDSTPDQSTHYGPATQSISIEINVIAVALGQYVKRLSACGPVPGCGVI